MLARFLFLGEVRGSLFSRRDRGITVAFLFMFARRRYIVIVREFENSGAYGRLFVVSR